MVDEQTVWQDVWPPVERLIQATLAEDNQAIRPLLAPGQPALAAYELFGHPVLDLLLKTVLGRARLAVTRAVETENGRYIFIEFVWPDPEREDGGYSAADLVTVRLQQSGRQWRITEINPAAIELPLTGARARGIMVSSKVVRETDKIAVEPWLLPVALFSGALQLPLRENAAGDAVEAALLPGLQAQQYGLLSLIAGRRLWRDFQKKDKPGLDQPAAWAAAVAFILNEQTMRDQSQAAVARLYQANLPLMISRSNSIKAALAIQGLDERYSSLRPAQIILQGDR
jgi:hypothetical protein